MSTTLKRIDTNAPKRPTTAYMRFLNANREQIVTDHFTNEDGECILVGREKVTLVAKKAGELWKQMTDEEKKPFVDAAEKAGAEYRSRYNDWIVRVGVENGSRSQEIHRLRVDNSHKAREISQLQEQVEKQKLEMNKKDQEYNDLRSDYENLEGMTQDTTSYEIQHYRKIVPRDVRLLEWKKYVCWISEEEFKTQWTNLAGDIEGAIALKAKYDKQPKIPDHLLESQEVVTEDVVEESDEESDEECIELELFEYDSKEYLMDPDTKEVYDYEVYMNSEDAVKIGTWNPATEKVEFE